MKVLIVKTSSMGDIIHTLPAVTDAYKALPNIEFDWLVEERFAAIPKWHPAVKHVIPVAFRRLRKKGLLLFFNKEWRQFKKSLASKQYDLIIDAQGLMKSSHLARLAKGPRAGFDKHSAREKYAALSYHHTFKVSKDLHSINRLRRLFAGLLNYTFDDSTLDYGLATSAIPKPVDILPEKYSVFIVNTTWPSKMWPKVYWQQLLRMMAEEQQAVAIPGGYSSELQHVKQLTAPFENAHVLEQSSLEKILSVLAHSQCTVSVDTGFSHLSAALDKPTITLYGPTDPKTVGTKGNNQIHLAADFACAPCKKKQCDYTSPSEVQPACFATVSPQRVWPFIKKELSADESV